MLKSNTKYPFSPIAVFFTCLVLITNYVNGQQKDSIRKNTNYKTVSFNGTDGPYIIKDTLYRVNALNKLIKRTNFKKDSLIVCPGNGYDDNFFLALRPKYTVTKSTFEAADKMVVISDIEGNFNAFSSFLAANGVIDAQYDWIYRTGRLVLVGDFVDRGKNVTQVLWLIYKLEQQARDAGGSVHLILGNHEVLNFKGDYTYNRAKYIKIAQEISGEKNKKKAIRYMFSEQSELGKWLLSKNVIEKIGSYIFVHAGLSPQLLDFKLSIDDINQKMRREYTSTENSSSRSIQFLYSSKGPIWYRGLVTKRPYYPKIGSEELDKILSFYNAKKIVVGHTPVKNISTDYDGKVIRIDVSHGLSKFSGKTKGLLIERGQEYIINDKGQRFSLK
ncbi:hypothetical protein GCM10009117_08710 [Gangjinia marincola]|uniref:Calcineurin-like phosphoesterase domain-containing protein n=1 Tax=Gangjinia marincola TaxID=578463 RepID=A0ABN1MF47_9FLAO